MRLDRLDAQAQHLGDPAGAGALADELENFQFAVAQLFELGALGAGFVLATRDNNLAVM